VIRSFRAAMGAALVLSLLTGTAGAAPDGEQRYVVVLESDGTDVTQTADLLTSRHGSQTEQVFRHALRGFTATMTTSEAAALALEPQVAYVELDQVRSIGTQTTPTGISRVFASSNPNIDIDATDDFRVDVDVAVIDTGVDLQHPDLNIAGGVNCLSGTCVTGGDDDHYHGTHVAGTIGALDNDYGVVGVAPGARIWAVKVLNRRGTGTSSQVIAGIDWVAANAATIEIANMSLGGPGFSQAEYDAVQGAVNAGVAFAVSAGNDTADANNYSPASFDNVLTVSAIADFDGAPGALGGPFCDVDQDDTSAWYSNYGTAVGIAAPGSCILSTYPLERGSYGTISGTSMASPHVAGALALLASADNPDSAADVDDLYSTVIDAGNFGWTDQSGDGIHEPLLDVTGFLPVLIATGGGGDGDPTVSITAPASGSVYESGESTTFVGTASDDEDGDLTGSVGWTSSLDGSLGTGGSITVSLSDGTHTITASVTDSTGNTSTDEITVTVQPDGGSPIVLTAVATTDRGRSVSVLTWTGATGRTVEIIRNGVVIQTANNNGTYSDRLTGTQTGNTYTYQVCEIGTGVCSNEASVSY